MPVKRALKPSEVSYYNFALLSHKGWVRAKNEDRLGAFQFFAADNAKIPVFLAVLCDGVGGHQGGEIAAEIGVDAVHKTIAECESIQEPAKLLEKALISANQHILQVYRDKPEMDGMASTCIAFLLIGRQLYLANLGDSRAYLLREGKLTQLNYDHTWLEDSLGIGLGNRVGITRDHPLAHVLSRHLGSSHPINVDLRIRAGEVKADGEKANQRMVLKKGDRLLLCSDGLTDMLNDREIVHLLDCDSPRKNAQNLVLSALEKGGHDNISVIVVHIP